ncbi:MAG: NUDIX hydrolase [Chloroflexota bacterium]|nr:NUDIX hydrolase [Chloroflexota bacterium]
MSGTSEGDILQKKGKPLGEQLGWHLLGTTYPFISPWFVLRLDRVELDGKDEPIDFSYLEHPGAVGIVPVTKEGKVILIRQYRYAIDGWSVEVPAGGMHDADGATHEEVACKEIEQEIGATCGELQYFGCYYTTVGQSDQAYHIYLALDVTLTREQSTEETEEIYVKPVSAAEALAMSRDGRIKDGNSALALLLCERIFRERGYI